MNDIRVGKFLNLPESKQCEFFDHYERMKKEFKVISRENALFRERFNALKEEGSQ